MVPFRLPEMGCHWIIYIILISGIPFVLTDLTVFADF